jgi:hypothetical protein
VTEITNTKVTISVSQEYDTGYVFIDGEQIKIGGVSNLVLVNDQVYEIVFEKARLSEQDSSEPGSKRILQANLLGYIESEHFYLGSNGENPSVFDNVYTLTDAEYRIYYSGSKSKSVVQIGKHLFHNTRFDINIDDFFASHILICGNTGSGKSNTINRLFTELFSNYEIKDSYFLFIDTNGEYKNAFSSDKKIMVLDTKSKKKNTFTIPIHLLEHEDWKVLLEATDKTQYPIIKKVINGLKKNVYSRSTNPYAYILQRLLETVEAILGSSNSPSVKLNGLKGLLNEVDMEEGPYSDWLPLIGIANNYIVNYQNITKKASSRTDDRTDDLINELKTAIEGMGQTKTNFSCRDLLRLIQLEHYVRVYRYNTNENNTSPMIARFVSHLFELETIIDDFASAGSTETLKDLIFSDNHIVLCDVKNAKRDIKRIMVAFICRKLYQLFQKNQSNESFHIIIDEAHNYLSDLNQANEDAISSDAIDTFETIIKEGRKYGVFLCMSTQRPNEITQTLLSQSHNYIIHKLVNPNDIAIIQKTVPFIDARSMESISILAPGQAIFSGTAFSRPSIVIVDYSRDYSTFVESETIKLTKSWKQKTVIK